MTTTVKVSAHCASDIVVVVRLERDHDHAETIPLLDGEEWEGYVYDIRSITVKEVKR